MPGPDNSDSVLVQCGGSSQDCYERAARDCPDGYELLSSDTRTSTAMVPGMSHTTTSVVGGSLVNNTVTGPPGTVQNSQLELLIRCKNAGPAPDWNTSAPPDLALGYKLGGTPADGQATCERQGHSWTESASGGLCDGIAPSLSLDGRVGLAFCDGQVCRVDVMGHLASKIDVPWRHKLDRIREELSSHYGPPVRTQITTPDGCEDDHLLDCIVNGRAIRAYRWKWSSGPTIYLGLIAADGAPAIRIAYDVGHAQAEAAKDSL